jgi:hypothetical protein
MNLKLQPAHATPLPCTCDSCPWHGDESELDIIQDAEHRLEPGDTVPAGECPACGALAYIARERFACAS